MTNAADRPLRVVAAVTWHHDRVLITRRPPGGAHALEWEFPGGKIEPGETPAQALIREIREELGVVAVAGRVLATHRHTYASGLSVEITFMLCALGSLEFVSSAAVHELRWCHPEELDPGEMLEADRDFVRELAERYPGQYERMRDEI